MNFQRLVVGVVVVVLLVVAGLWFYWQYLAPESENEAVAAVEVAPVNTGIDLVSAEGQIVPLRHANLAFAAGGQVAEILVREGEQVMAGQLLVRLEAAELEAAVAQAEAAVAQAQAALEVAEAQVEAAEASVQVANSGVAAAQAQLNLAAAAPRPEEIAALQSNLAGAEAAVSQAAANRDLVLSAVTAAEIQAAEAQVAAAAAEKRVRQDQYDQIIRTGVGGMPEEQARFALNAAEASLAAAQASLDQLNAGPKAAERQAANAAVAAAAAQRDALQAQLDLLLAGARPEQVAIAEVGVQQARAAVIQAETAVTLARAAVAQAEAAVAQAEGAREAARATRDKMNLYAPFDGTVASLPLELGEIVSPGVPVAVVADLSGWLVKTTDLTELDVVVVAAGYPVTIRIDAIPNEALSGQVTAVASVSTLSRGNVTYPVTIALDNTGNLPLRWGMTVFVDIAVR